MNNQNLLTIDINNQQIAVRYFALNANTHNNTFAATLAQALTVYSISFVETYQGGDDDDDPIVPPN